MRLSGNYRLAWLYTAVWGRVVWRTNRYISYGCVSRLYQSVNWSRGRTGWSASSSHTPAAKMWSVRGSGRPFVYKWHAGRPGLRI